MCELILLVEDHTPKVLPVWLCYWERQPIDVPTQLRQRDDVPFRPRKSKAIGQFPLQSSPELQLLVLLKPQNRIVVLFQLLIIFLDLVEADAIVFPASSTPTTTATPSTISATLHRN